MNLKSVLKISWLVLSLSVWGSLSQASPCTQDLREDVTCKSADGLYSFEFDATTADQSETFVGLGHLNYCEQSKTVINGFVTNQWQTGEGLTRVWNPNLITEEDIQIISNEFGMDIQPFWDKVQSQMTVTAILDLYVSPEVQLKSGLGGVDGLHVYRLKDPTKGLLVSSKGKLTELSCSENP